MMKMEDVDVLDLDLDQVQALTMYSICMYLLFDRNFL